MMFDVCTHMLYSADPTVRVRTDPALRLVIATAIPSKSGHFHDLRFGKVLGVHTNDRMHVWEAHHHQIQHVSPPRMRLSTRQDLQGNQKRQYPDLTAKYDEIAIVDLLRHPSPSYKLYDKERVRWYGQEISLKGIELQPFQDECDVS